MAEAWAQAAMKGTNKIIANRFNIMKTSIFSTSLTLILPVEFPYLKISSPHFSSRLEQTAKIRLPCLIGHPYGDSQRPPHVALQGFLWWIPRFGGVRSHTPKSGTYHRIPQRTPHVLIEDVQGGGIIMPDLFPGLSTSASSGDAFSWEPILWLFRISCGITPKSGHLHGDSQRPHFIDLRNKEDR